MNKKIIIVFLPLLMICNFCFSREIKSIRVELTQKTKEAEKTVIVYDSEKEFASYPFVIFKGALTGWGNKDGCKKLRPFLVPKSVCSEGIYIVYVTTDESDLTQKFRILNFEAMQDIQTHVYYKTDFLLYLYEYLARKYLKTL